MPGQIEIDPSRTARTTWEGTPLHPTAIHIEIHARLTEAKLARQGSRSMIEVRRSRSVAAATLQVTSSRPAS